MQKIDFKKTLRDLYNPPRKPVIIDVPEMQFLMIDGKGDPNTALEYQEALQALYPVAFTLKFMLKKTGVLDYTVPPLEGLWWAKNMDVFTIDGRKDEWLWTMMIMQPQQVTQVQLKEAIDDVRRKKNPKLLDRIRLETYHEGLAVQIMHIGPYSEEGPIIQRMHQHAFDEGYKLHRKHHEIYLSDPRRAKPEKMRTVIRQPIKET